MDFDWRTWAYSQVSGDTTVRSLLSQWGSGAAAAAGVMSSVDKPPGKHPFIVMRMDAEVPGPFQGVAVARLVVAAHDEPGSYLRIGNLLRAARTALIGAVAQQGQVVALGAVAIKWMGDSADLSDPDLKTIFRSSSYDLFGKDGGS